MVNEPDKDNRDVSGYTVGQTVVVRVVALEQYGAYVELEPGVVGLVLIPEIRWSPVRHPGDVLRVGDEVRAEVLVATCPQRKLSLSIKRLLPEGEPDGRTAWPSHPTSSPGGD